MCLSINKKMDNPQLGQKVYDGDSYKEYDDTLGGSPYVGGSVDNLINNKSPIEAAVVGLIVLGILGLVIYILVESTLDPMLLYATGAALGIYLVWENLGDTIQKLFY